MADEIFDRTYQGNRAEFHAGIDRALARAARRFGEGLKAFHRIQWSAPWNNDGNRAHCG